MSQKSIAGALFLKELEAEAPATRKCLERITLDDPEWKPHEKSMPLAYLAALVAAMPKWIQAMIDESEIDLATFEQFTPKNTDELTEYFDKNLAAARKSLENLTDDMLDETFSLKNSGETLYSTPKGDNIGSTLNHWVHHRGQLTVYMRLMDVPVPSVYGPSADDRSF